MKSILLIASFYSFFFKASYSSEFPRLFGCFCEGGVIIGKANKNDFVEINKKRVKIFKNGEFIFAFGRNFKEKVSINFNDNLREFNVEQKKYNIERIQGLPRAKVEPSEKDLKKIKLDQKLIINAKKIGEKKKLFNNEFILPVNGRLTGFFGSQRILNKKPKRPHYGIDIAQKKGAPIVAPSSGKVKLVAKEMFFTGNTVILDHGLGLISIFAHMDEILVENGQFVSIGETLGSVGMTGRATGPHLHWGVYLENTPVDPMSLLSRSFF